MLREWFIQKSIWFIIDRLSVIRTTITKLSENILNIRLSAIFWISDGAKIKPKIWIHAATCTRDHETMIDEIGGYPPLFLFPYRSFPSPLPWLRWLVRQIWICPTSHLIPAYSEDISLWSTSYSDSMTRWGTPSSCPPSDVSNREWGSTLDTQGRANRNQMRASPSVVNRRW